MKNDKSFIESYVNDVFGEHLSFDYPDEPPHVIVSYNELVTAINKVILDAVHDTDLQKAAFCFSESKALLSLLKMSVDDSDKGLVISSSELKEKFMQRKTSSSC